MDHLSRTYKLTLEDFSLAADDFDHRSLIHGVGHVYRVMLHCLKLGIALDAVEEARLAFFAAFLHDLCRKHDGLCREHGRWAAETKFPLYLPLFSRYGADEPDREKIQTAILYHSLREELPLSHPAWKVTAILKDADALDRIRLGENDLNPDYLRFPETLEQIEAARQLYYRTVNQPLGGFKEFVEEWEQGW